MPEPLSAAARTLRARIAALTRAAHCDDWALTENAMGPPIGPSAKAHGISDQRIWEAYRNPVTEFVLRNGVTVELGYDSQANLLEIAWIDRGQGRRIIHAMVCRTAWRREYELP